MRSATAAAVFVLVASACTADDPPRWLVVQERFELCATAPLSAPLDQVQATQWRLGIEAGEYLLPDAQRLPEGNFVLVADGSAMPSLLEVRDVDGMSPFDADPEAAVLEHADPLLEADDALDVLQVWSWLDMLLGDHGAWRLSLITATNTGEDFRIDRRPDVRFSCFGDAPTGPCPNRSFDACDPGGPTVRTRVTLDRGEVVLDVRYVERMPIDGDPNRSMFVAAQVHVDEVEFAHDDFFRLLHTAQYEEIGDGSYAVLAPDALEPAGLGCGVVIADVGTDAPRASLVDCGLQELEPLAISDVVREVLP